MDEMQNDNTSMPADDSATEETTTSPEEVVEEEAGEMSAEAEGDSSMDQPAGDEEAAV